MKKLTFLPGGNDRIEIVVDGYLSGSLTATLAVTNDPCSKRPEFITAIDTMKNTLLMLGTAGVLKEGNEAEEAIQTTLDWIVNKYGG